MKLRQRIILSSTFGGLAIAVLFASCGRTNQPSGPSTGGYFLQSHLVSNFDLDQSFSTVFFRQNQTQIPSGPVNLNGGTHSYSAATGLHRLQIGSSAAIDSGTHTLALFDGGKSVINLQFSLPSEPQVAVSDPANRIYTSTVGNVTCSVIVASGASGGHVIAVVKADRAYLDTGYAAPIGGNSAIIPPDVFLTPGTNDLDTGLWYIYVYAFSGTPLIDSVATDFPTKIDTINSSDNLSTATIEGRFGALVISRRDSLFVQQL